MTAQVPNPAPAAPASRREVLKRSCGVLIHPTSLPGPYGIGEIGAEARRMIDFLAEAGQGLWQVMPLGPTGYGDSPYQSFSAFAGNPLLISLDELVERGLLKKGNLKSAPKFPAERVDFGPVIEWKSKILREAFAQWREKAGSDAGFQQYRSDHASWLNDYALFMALKSAHGGAPWNLWPDEYKYRREDALSRAQSELADEILCHSFLQYTFFRQWSGLRAHAAAKKIRIIGDIPIFVAYDSSDVWSAPDLFHLDGKRDPICVAGVPPDYFSPTGQRWGNPLYRWDAMARDGYAWWVRRFRSVLEFVDIIRIDHFRGFESYWEVPASEPTAMNGKWVAAPGRDLFEVLQRELKGCEIIAEDLGVITEEVEALRRDAGLPGMKVLQFGFSDDATNPYIPHNVAPDSVVYTGTHDNDTTRGWYEAATEKEQHRFRCYTASDGSVPHKTMIRFAYASVGRYAIVPMQDVLGLGSEARMNFPGRESGNWGWRYKAGETAPELAAELRELAELYGRCFEEK